MAEGSSMGATLSYEGLLKLMTEEELRGVVMEVVSTSDN